jgi:flagellar biosynthesis protein FliQ
MVAMMFLLPFMLTTLSGFTEHLVDRIIVHKETTS